MKKIILSVLILAFLLFPMTAFAGDRGSGPNNHQSTVPENIENQN